MNINLISFTENGAGIADRISKRKLVFEEEQVSFVHAFAGTGTIDHSGITTEKNGVKRIQLKRSCTKDYIEECFKKKEPVVIIGACGIAVRLIAHFISDKLHDIPVVVIDELGKYVIPILSGHFGGANDLARKLSLILKNECIITTATDLNDEFAVDVFAKKNYLSVNDRNMIIHVSSKILCGEKVSVRIADGISYDKKKLPDKLYLLPKDSDEKPDILITDDKDDENGMLILNPRRFVLGIGCRQGTGAEDIKAFVSKVLSENGSSLDDVCYVSSIDLKMNEPGLKEFASENRLRFTTYSADELNKVRGDFTSSDFVKSKTGVDNVCERAAVKACGRGGELIVGKQADNGITVAVAVRKVRIKFDV